MLSMILILFSVVTVTLTQTALGTLAVLTTLNTLSGLTATQKRKIVAASSCFRWDKIREHCREEPIYLWQSGGR